MVGLSTLDSATTPGALTLPRSPLALRRAGSGPVLSAVAALSPDGYGVGGMCVQRVDAGDGVYYMWYTGVPENEFAQKIYLARSNDGVSWTKEPDPVLSLGATGSFDSRQLGKPSVIYDPTNLAAPFRMWYSAEGDFGGSIGYATSLDGRSWTKAGEVFGPGRLGMADSYSVSQPCIIIDNGIYRMWYTASDGNNRRIGYASSLDGLDWQRGGIVFDVTPGGNYSQGAYAPTVWTSGTTYNMVFTAAKDTGGGIQTKLYNASTGDGGVTWVPGSVAHNAGNATDFDGTNMSQPDVLVDPADTTWPYKMWYVGNTVDPNNPGLNHDRIGLVGQKTGTWKDISGPTGDPFYGAVLTLGEQNTAFDSMDVADLRPALGMTKGAGPAGYVLTGWVTGTRASDSIPRIGCVFSSDSGTTWGSSSLVFDAGPAGSFDAHGVAAPAAVWIDGTPTPDQGYWLVYHTSISSTSALTIGLHKVDALGSVTRYAAPVVAAGLSGAGFDSGGCADPALTSAGLFYAGRDGSGIWSIMRTTGSTGGPPPSYTGAAQALAAGPEPYDAGGARHPVILEGGATWYLWYQARGSDGVDRIALAISTDGGATWTKEGLAMSPSTAPYDFSEQGLAPSGAWQAPGGGAVTLWFTGTDRFGWERVGAATAADAGYLDGGSATYELDNADVRDWRRIAWNPVSQPAGTDLQIWVSYFPTFSGEWSQFFQVQRDTDLPFLLTVKSMRWQVRMTSSTPASSPRLNDLTVNHAPLSFPTSGIATTVPLGPPTGKYLLSWGDLTCNADVPAGAGLTVSVEDEGGAQVLAPQAVTSAGQTISLAAVPATSGRLVAVFGFTGDGVSTAKLKSLGVTFTSTATPSTLTLASAKAIVSFGGSTTLSGTLMSETTPLTGQTVTIESRTLAQTSFSPLTTATTGADGSFSAAVTPQANTVYRASWVGGDVSSVTYPPASATARIDVKAKVTIKMTGYRARSGKYFVYGFGHKVACKGVVSPNHSKLGDGVTGGKVVLKAYRLRNSRWVLTKSVTRALSTTSGYTWSWTPKARGTYRIRTSFPADVDHLAGLSAYKYFKVK